MRSLRYLFWLSAIFNFHLTACFIPGIYNTVADSASRLHTPGLLETLLPYTVYSTLHLHMSHTVLLFCLTDSLTGCQGPQIGLNHPTAMQHQQSTLSASLDRDMLEYQCSSFASSTAKTYLIHISSCLEFCNRLNIKPVPVSQTDLGRYIAHLSRCLSFSSTHQYLNAVRLLHLEAGVKNPPEGNWYVTSILKGVKRVKGDVTKQKLPITLDILKGVFLSLDLKDQVDRTFRAVCLVAFYSFFRKSNLKVESHIVFDPSRHLCATDVQFTPDGAILTVRWSKVIQYHQRILQVPLPRTANSPFCPSTALLQLMLYNPEAPFPVPLFRYTLPGASHVPLTQQRFTEKLHCCLRSLSIPPSDYSTHFARAGPLLLCSVGCRLTL